VQLCDFRRFLAGYATTQHLLSLASTRWLYDYYSASDSCVHRYHGYRQCLLDHHLPFDENLLLDTLSQMHDFSSSAPVLSHSPGQDDLMRVCDYLRQPHRPTAVVARTTM